MICPRCDRQGRVCRARVRASGVEVYVCDACQALWTHAQAIGPATAVDLGLFLSSQGLEGRWELLESVESDWQDTQSLSAARALVAEQPDNRAARLSLGKLLVESGAAVEALDQLAVVLSHDPANVDALQAAASAAVAAGDAARAEGYLRLLSALSGAPHHLDADRAGPEKAGAAAGPEPWRELLRVPEPTEKLPEAADPGAGETPADDDLWQGERSSITLADVAGMESVKRRLNIAFLGPLQNPELRRLYGKSLRGGLMLYGPPGCGKTFFARALAGELGARFISIGLSDVLDMWLGESERKLHEIFQSARRLAPSVLFFDEIDALGQRRSQLRYQGGRRVVNQLLAELDGVDSSNDGVFVLGATNHPWDVDAALLRPGRFDRMVLVLPPDEAARAAVIQHGLKDRPAVGVDVASIAATTKDFSGADLAHLCESAAELAIEASLQSGRPRPITTADLRTALRDIKPSTRGWFETARNYVLFANEGGLYDELQTYMRANRLL